MGIGPSTSPLGAKSHALPSARMMKGSFPESQSKPIPLSLPRKPGAFVGWKSMPSPDGATHEPRMVAPLGSLTSLFGSHPVDELLFLRPGPALEVCRGAVVHDVAVRGPGESPVGRDPVVSLAVPRPVHALLGDHAGIDPCAAHGRTVFLAVGEGRKRLLVRPGVAVDLL